MTSASGDSSDAIVATMETVRVKRLCVFCGSSAGQNPEYAGAARQVGRLIASRGIALVYGGASIGLMGMVADGALEAGGEVIGVLPKTLARREVSHSDLSELHIVDTMHERKAMMANLADGFMALPGGCGTFDELFEVITWAQIGVHAKPIAILNTAGYYDPLIALFEHAISQRFVHKDHQKLILHGTDPVALLDKMINYKPSIMVEKWLDPSGI